jgi:hypothetical protein
MSVFGPIVLASDVDAAVVSTIRRWLPTEIAQIQRDVNLPYQVQLPRDNAYATVLEDEPALLDPLPAVLVTTGGTSGTPEPGGDGMVSATWAVTVTAIVRGRNKRETRQQAAIYEAAIRRALLHNRTLDGWAASTYWQGMTIGPVADTTDKGRTIAAGQSTWLVAVDEVVQQSVGPDTPDPPDNPPDPTDPFGEWPLVESIDVRFE